MQHRSRMSQKTLRLVGTAILAAIVVVLTIFCNAIKIGPVVITLALAPIIVGGAMFGCVAGAVLGGVFGLVVLLTGLAGMDGGLVIYLMGLNPAATILLCIVKGAAAGWLASLVYKAMEKKNTLAAVIMAGVVCPVVNTGLFILGMMAFFMGTLNGWAAGEGQNLMAYLILTLTGINFLIELGVNLLLSTGITRIIHAGKKQLG